MSLCATIFCQVKDNSGNWKMLNINNEPYVYQGAIRDFFSSDADGNIMQDNFDETRISKKLYNNIKKQYSNNYCYGYWKYITTSECFRILDDMSNKLNEALLNKLNERDILLINEKMDEKLSLIMEKLNIDIPKKQDNNFYDDDEYNNLEYINELIDDIKENIGDIEYVSNFIIFIEQTCALLIKDGCLGKDNTIEIYYNIS